MCVGLGHKEIAGGCVIRIQGERGWGVMETQRGSGSGCDYEPIREGWGVMGTQGESGWV